MSNVTHHPDLAMLARYAQGLLDDAQSDELEAHLASCALCCDRLADSAGDDPFLEQLRAAVRDEPGPAPRADRIGRFRLDRQLGAGAFGVVFVAYDEQLHRTVALKMPRAGTLPTLATRDRFLREARAAAALDHPNILPVYEAGEEHGYCYIASALSRGPTLAAWLRDRTELVPPRTAAAIVAELADGVHHAHHRRVLHRDIKPSNVLLDPVDGNSRSGELNEPASRHRLDVTLPFLARLTDFGLARFGAADEGAQGAFVGTAAYVSPEQAAGNEAELGPPSDVYSLGALLYEILAGRPPLVGETDQDVLRRLPTEEPVAPRRLRPGIPRDLETICLKCLDKQPYNRYATARGLAEDLDRFLVGKPIVARPVGAVGRALKWARRRPASAGLGGLLAVALLVIGCLLVQFNLRLREELDRVTAAERQGSEHLWEAELATAAARRQSRSAGQKFESLESLARAVELGRRLRLGAVAGRRLRDETIACLALSDVRVDGRYPLTVADHGARRIAVDEQLERVVVLRDDGGIEVRALAEDPDARRLAAPAGPAKQIALSPDGRHLAACAGEAAARAFVWALDDSAAGARELEVEQPSTLAFCPHGRRLVVVARDGLATILSLPELARLATFPTIAAAAGAAFDARGDRLAVWSGSAVQIVDLETTEVVAVLEHAPGNLVQSAAFSPDGDWIVTGGSQHLAHVWRIERDAAVETLRGHQKWVSGVNFSPDGSIVATTSLDGTTRFWEHWTGKELLVRRGSLLRFAADGRRAAGLAGAELERIEFSPGLRRTMRARDVSYDVYGCHAARDGRLVVSWNHHGVQLWDTRATVELARLDIGWTYWAALRAQGNDLSVIAGTEFGLMSIGVRRGDDGSFVAFEPPEKLPLPAEIECADSGALSADGGTLCVAAGRVACVLRFDGSPAMPALRDPRLGAVAASRDGRFLAACAQHLPGLLLWDTRSADSPVVVLADETIASFAFDGGDELIADTGQQLVGYDPRARREMARVDFPESGSAPNWRGAMSLAAESGLCAVSRPGYRVALFDWRRREPVAVLPAELPNAALSLSADGRRLSCLGADFALQTWDLGAIRARLDQCGLDW